MGKCKKEKKCHSHEHHDHGELLVFTGDITNNVADTEYALYPWKSVLNNDGSAVVLTVPTDQFAALNESIALPQGTHIDDILVSIASVVSLGTAVTYTVNVYTGINPLSAFGSTAIATKTLLVPSTSDFTKLDFPVSLNIPAGNYVVVTVSSDTSLGQFETDTWINVTLQ